MALKVVKRVSVTIDYSLEAYQRMLKWFGRDDTEAFIYIGLEEPKKKWFSRWVEPSRPELVSMGATTTLEIVQFDEGVSLIQAMEILLEERMGLGLPMDLLMIGEQCPDFLPEQSCTAALHPLFLVSQEERDSMRIPVLQKRSRGRFIINLWAATAILEKENQWFLISPS